MTPSSLLSTRELAFADVGPSRHGRALASLLAVRVALFVGGVIVGAVSRPSAADDTWLADDTLLLAVVIVVAAISAVWSTYIDTADPIHRSPLSLLQWLPLTDRQVRSLIRARALGRLAAIITATMSVGLGIAAGTGALGPGAVVDLLEAASYGVLLAVGPISLALWGIPGSGWQRRWPVVAALLLVVTVLIVTWISRVMPIEVVVDVLAPTRRWTLEFLGATEAGLGGQLGYPALYLASILGAVELRARATQLDLEIACHQGRAPSNRARRSPFLADRPRRFNLRRFVQELDAQAKDAQFLSAVAASMAFGSLLLLGIAMLPSSIRDLAEPPLAGLFGLIAAAPAIGTFPVATSLGEEPRWRAGAHLPSVRYRQVLSGLAWTFPLFSVGAVVFFATANNPADALERAWLGALAMILATFAAGVCLATIDPALVTRRGSVLLGGLASFFVLVPSAAIELAGSVVLSTLLLATLLAACIELESRLAGLIDRPLRLRRSAPGGSPRSTDPRNTTQEERQ